MGRRLDLVKQVGRRGSSRPRTAFRGIAGPLAIGHTRMSTESRIDLSHSQPFWVTVSLTWRRCTTGT